MELWSEVRCRVLTGELSKRAACREYGIHWQTLAKMLQHPEPPGYRQTKDRLSKLDPFLPVIKEILVGNRQVHRKQRHTSKRIFEQLRDEHGYDGEFTLVKDAVRAWRQQHQEVFLPWSAMTPRACTSSTAMTGRQNVSRGQRRTEQAAV